MGAVSLGGFAGCGVRSPTADGTDESGSSEGSDDDSGTSDGDDRDALPTEWPAGEYAEYETTTVTVTGAGGDEHGSVTAAIADTRDKRILGLSAARSLPENGGMLFVYDAPQESLTYIMPEMSFGIDIIYVDADRTITRIHNAPQPGPNEDGSDQRYPGSGQYVLEVPFNWSSRNGVAVGDSLTFQL